MHNSQNATIGTFLLMIAVPSLCSAAPTLMSAANFAVLAGTTVTSTGSTQIGGDVGVSPGTAITGFSAGVVESPFQLYSGGSVAQTAENDLETAYSSLATEAYATDLSNSDLGGQTLLPGVYHYDSSTELTGTLTLNGDGDSNSLFIIQTGSTLTTANASSVDLINGANADNVYWVVGSSATLGSGSAFAGNILADTSITLDPDATILDGRALAINGAVTLTSNSIDIPAAEEPAPESSALNCFALGLLTLGFLAVYSKHRPVRPRQM